MQRTERRAVDQKTDIRGKNGARREGHGGTFVLCHFHYKMFMQAAVCKMG